MARGDRGHSDNCYETKPHADCSSSRTGLRVDFRDRSQLPRIGRPNSRTRIIIQRKAIARNSASMTGHAGRKRASRSSRRSSNARLCEPRVSKGRVSPSTRCRDLHAQRIRTAETIIEAASPQNPASNEIAATEDDRRRIGAWVSSRTRRRIRTQARSQREPSAAL